MKIKDEALAQAGSVPPAVRQYLEHVIRNRVHGLGLVIELFERAPLSVSTTAFHAR